MADSLWSFVSFERNLHVLIFSEPTSLIDTLLLRVSPYQVVSRIIVVVLFILTGTLLFEFMGIKQRAEAAYRESEEKYRALVNNTSEAIFVAQDRFIKFPNPKTAELTGYVPMELIGEPFERFIHPEDRSGVINRYQERINREDSPISHQFRVVRKDGQIVWVQLNTAHIQWEGQPATLNFLSDISEEKRLAEQLQRAEKMEAVGMLAGGVAHDLNNILSGLVSYPDLLLMDLQPDSPLREPILTMQKSGKKAAMIVQDLLTLARRGLSIVNVLNLNDIIREYLAAPEFERMKAFHPLVKVRCQLAPDLLNVLGSPVHLSKTVMNLVSNAAEACVQGGVVTLTTSNQTLDRPLKKYEKVQGGDYVVLQVSDTGEGIDTEDMERIFEPFYTKKVLGRSGTGLGMAVVWGTVKDHDGYIDIDSTVGRGTTVKVYLPVTRKELDRQKNHPQIQELIGNGEKVLVVDDVAEQRQICSLMLDKLGYAVHTVASGEDAVAFMQTHTVDLILLDMIMDPGIDGLDTYRQIARIRPGQKVLIASGFAETERVEEMQRMGAGPYIKKPYTFEKIGSAVKDELGR
jgi:PAS domain S-box-containing protein